MNPMIENYLHLLVRLQPPNPPLFVVTLTSFQVHPWSCCEVNLCILRGTQIFSVVVFFSFCQNVASDYHIHKCVLFLYWEMHFLNNLIPKNQSLNGALYFKVLPRIPLLPSNQQNQFFNVQHIFCDKFFKKRSLNSEKLGAVQNVFRIFSHKLPAVTSKMIIEKEIHVL